MKKSLFFVGILFMMSLVSAQIVIDEQPAGSYNFGDVINVQVKVVAPEDVQGTLYAHSRCGDFSNRTFSRDVVLSGGKEETYSVQVIVNEERFGDRTGKCFLEFTLGKREPALTNEFNVSNRIILNAEAEKTTILPGEKLIVRGRASKEYGGPVNDGFAGFEISPEDGGSDSQFFQESVINGNFVFNYPVSDDFRAGRYSVNLEVYEKDAENRKTNRGSSEIVFIVSQVPTSLEIFHKDSERKTEPDRNFSIKGILRDQTGEKIPSDFSFTVRNGRNRVVERATVSSEDFFEISVPYDEPPSSWKILAESMGITNEVTFEIIEKKAFSVWFVNSTLIVRNVGNVFHDGTLSVRIGTNFFEITPYLEVGRSRKYSLAAPEGNYEVEVSNGTHVMVKENLFLTGSDFALFSSQESLNFIIYPVMWTFLIIVLCLASYYIYRKVRRKNFYVEGKEIPAKKESSEKSEEKEEKSGIKNRAEISLSVRGEKRGAAIICLKIKNMDRLLSDEDFLETLGKITRIAENRKAFIYEIRNHLFFILAPAVTKTFKNEKAGMEISENVKNVIEEHNRKTKPKIESGISLNHGEMVAAKEGNVLKFMSLGNVIVKSRKLSSFSKGEILISADTKDRIMSDVKVEKRKEGKTEFYEVTEIRKRDDERKFISDFIKRIEKK